MFKTRLKPSDIDKDIKKLETRLNMGVFALLTVLIAVSLIDEQGISILIETVKKIIGN